MLSTTIFKLKFGFKVIPLDLINHPLCYLSSTQHRKLTSEFKSLLEDMKEVDIWDIYSIIRFLDISILWIDTPLLTLGTMFLQPDITPKMEFWRRLIKFVRFFQFSYVLLVDSVFVIFVMPFYHKLPQGVEINLTMFYP